MGRTQVYSTPEEKKAANRAKSKRHYERNKVAIRERRRAKYNGVKPATIVLSRGRAESAERDINQARRPLDHWRSSAVQVKNKYDELTSSAPKDFAKSIVQNIISNQKDGPLRHAVDFISDLLKRIQHAENEVLRQYGLCDLYQNIGTIKGQVKELSTWMEDILCYAMLNISELCAAFFNCELLYQTS